MELLQRPPDRLDVRVCIVQYASVGVDPEADPLGESPRTRRRTAGPTRGSSRLNSATPNASMSFLPGRADLLLDLDLDRQAVAIPAALPLHVVAGHRLEPREHVLEACAARRDGSRVGRSRSGALVEDPPRRAFRARRASDGRRRLASRRRGCASSRWGKLTFGSTGSNGMLDSSARHETPRPRCEDEALAPRYHLALPGPRGLGRSPAANTAFRDHGRSCLRLLRSAARPRPVRAGARGGCSPGARRRLPPSRLAPTAPTRLLVPVVAGIGDATRPRRTRSIGDGPRTGVRIRAPSGPRNAGSAVLRYSPDLREHGRYALFCYPSPPWRTASSPERDRRSEGSLR